MRTHYLELRMRLTQFNRAHVTHYHTADGKVLSDPEFAREDRYFHSTEEAFEVASRKAIRRIQLVKEMDPATQADLYYVRG